jgi:hypothetical protein
VHNIHQGLVFVYDYKKLLLNVPDQLSKKFTYASGYKIFLNFANNKQYSKCQNKPN